jgi:hypothetical protein
MPLNSACCVCRVHDDTDLNVPKLCCFGEIRRPDERPLPIDHDAFRMQASARAIALRHAARIVKHLWGPRSRPFVPQEALGEPPQQHVCARRVSRGTPHIKTEADGQIGHLSHALGEDSENFATLVNGESDYQNPMLSLREQLAEDDPGVACGAGDIGAACDQNDLGAMDLRSRLCRDSIEQQGGMFLS